MSQEKSFLSHSGVFDDQLPKNQQTTSSMRLSLTSSSQLQSRTNLSQMMSFCYHDDFVPSHQLGPDHVVPATRYWTCQPDEGVKMRIGFIGVGGLKPKSLVTMLRERVEKSGPRFAMSVKRNDVWQHRTYNQYWEEICYAAKGFLKLGLERFNAVAMLGFNSPEWVISIWAAICAGGVATGLYVTSSAESCQYVLDHSRANIVVVENAEQLQKILDVRDQLTHLKAIVQYLGTPTHEDVFSWDDVLQLGRTVEDEYLHTRIQSLAVNQVALIVYTSGTTGEPKAVMLNHDNVIATLECIDDFIDLIEEGERVVSYLPLNHVAAQAMDVFLPCRKGIHVYFAQPDALKGSLLATLTEVQPTIFFSVPRVYEKIKERLDDTFSNLRPLQKALINMAMKKSYEYCKNVLKGKLDKPCGYRIFEPLIRKLKTRLGLGKARLVFSAGAPISVDTLKFFMHLNTVVCELYGMSECNVHVLTVPKSIKLGSVGKPYVHNYIKLINMSENGAEICFRGRGVFMGYMFNESQTLEALESEHWLRTGDLGKFDDDGFLYITGRLKEIVITAGGENISPIAIEECVKAQLPLISQAVVIGDTRKFLSMLLTIKTVMDLDKNLPTDKLSPLTVKWCRNLGSNVETIQELLRDDKVLAAIQQGIDRANDKAASRACRIQKWKIMPKDFTLQADELGPTMKLKRPVIIGHYKDIIDSFYV